MSDLANPGNGLGGNNITANHVGGVLCGPGGHHGGGGQGDQGGEADGLVGDLEEVVVEVEENFKANENFSEIVEEILREFELINSETDNKKLKSQYFFSESLLDEYDMFNFHTSTQNGEVDQILREFEFEQINSEVGQCEAIELGREHDDQLIRDGDYQCREVMKSKKYKKKRWRRWKLRRGGGSKRGRDKNQGSLVLMHCNIRGYNSKKASLMQVIDDI